jgi:acyl carrier protein
MIMRDRIRTVLQRNAQLSVPVEELTDEANLYRAGLTSHATVNVMLALEDEFELELPESLLMRRTFESVAAIELALRSVPATRS